MANRTFKMTPARAEWLRELQDDPAVRRKTRVGFDCMTNGWTEWLWQREKELISSSELFAQYPNIRAASDAGWSVSFLEVLTPEGRAAIEAYDRATERGGAGDE